MKSTIRKLTLDQLVIPTEPGVQRVEGVHQPRVAAMAADFRPYLLRTITVSERADGTFAVIDGAHRVTAARAVGYKAPLVCEVFTGATLADEAHLFLGDNTSKQVSALSKFAARVAMSDPDAVAIHSIAKAHGWTISQCADPGCLSAIDALERVYRNAGGVLPDGTHVDLTDRVIGLLTVAWEHDRKSVDAPLLLGVAQLVGRCGPSLDDKKLIGEMQATRPGVLIGRAKTLRDAQGGTVPAALAKILVGMHNHKRRTNLLPDWVWVR